ncbi:MAG: hypothetical protein JWO57_2499 [Pseudonocardiales bacterium]|nr:hypothetical protein [Pseudonocardiales bacterium]
MSEACELGGGYLPTVMDADLDPDGVAAWAAHVAPGSAVITPLAAVAARRLSPAGRVDALRALDKQIGWLQAQQHKLLAAMAADAGPGSVDAVDKHWVREEVAAALRLSGPTATDRLCLAQALTRRPATLAMLEQGQISSHHARALAEAVNALDDQAAARVEAQVLAHAENQSLATFRRALNRAVLAAAPHTVEQQHEQALIRRRVVLTTVGDGMSELWALLPADGAATVMTALDALAVRTQPGDPRTADQRRADALVQLAVPILHGDLHGDQRDSAGLPQQHGMRPAVQVTVALSTLLGLDEQPGELGRVGPIPAALARRIAADPTGTWRRLVIDERGRLLDYGTTTYRPPKDLTDKVIARDRTCRFLNCNRPARTCHIDHCTPFSHGGPTSEANTHCLCSRHHHLKHETPWTVRQTGDGDSNWTSPTGHRYLEPAATYPVDHTTDSPIGSREGDPDPPPF